MKNKLLTKDNHKQIKNNLPTYTVLAVALLGMTFLGVCTPGGSLLGPSGLAAKINGEKVTNSDFRREYQAQERRMRQIYGDKYDPSAIKLAQTVINQLVKNRLLYIKGQDLGILKTEENVAQYLTDLNAFQDDDGKFSIEAFNNFLKSNDYSEASFFNELKQSLTLQTLNDFVTNTVFVSTKTVEWDYLLSESKMSVRYLALNSSDAKVTVSQKEKEQYLKRETAEAKIKSWYNANKAKYVTDEKVHARHILVGHNESKNATASAQKRTKQQAYTKAQALLQKVLAAKENFAAVAKKESDDPSGKTNGGDLGFFLREDMVKEFSDVAFKLDVNEVSQIVETPFGYHIIKTLSKEPAKNINIETAKSEIVEKLVEKEKAPQETQKIAQLVLDKLSQGKNIDSLLSENKLNWKTSKEFSLNTRYIEGIGSKEDVINNILSLKKKDEIYTKPLKIGSKFFIVQLVDKKQAKLDKLDDQKKKQLISSIRYSEGSKFFKQMEEQTRTYYEKNNKIYLNPEYLALDNPPENL